MLDSPRALRAASLQQWLRAAARPSGGWGYYVGKRSRVESTCWALAALLEAWDGGAESWNAFAAPHLAFLTACQRESGLLTDMADGPPNLAANGLAAWLLASAPLLSAGGPRLGSLQSGIVALKGVSVNAKDARQDNSLQAWPWYPDTFSWVEPTAWCLLALKQHARSGPDAAAPARVLEAERLMDNRCCDAGGWNYGNASALGQDLRPHVPPTALALLALQDRRELPSVIRSIGYLQGAQLSEQSGAALGLTAVCLHAYGLDTSEVLDRLAAVAERTETLGNVESVAIALYALTLDRHNGKLFRVAA